MSTEALSLSGLSAARAGRLVLDEISLSLQVGEWVALVGPNGAGKSTLLQVAAGLMKPLAGEVRLAGQPWAHWSARDRARRLAWLAQSPEGDVDMRVRDVVALGRLPHQGWLSWGAANGALDQVQIDLAMAQADVQEFSEAPLGALSGGERQRVHLARALATQAPVLLLDEPLAHLDAPHQRRVAQLLRQAANQQRAILSAMHELPFALQADRLAVLDRGRLLALGPATEPAVRSALLGVFEHAIEIGEVQGRWTAWPRP
jgi:iron complex transport system ATP-binding protein